MTASGEKHNIVIVGAGIIGRDYMYMIVVADMRIQAVARLITLPDTRHSPCKLTHFRYWKPLLLHQEPLGR